MSASLPRPCPLFSHRPHPRVEGPPQATLSAGDPEPRTPELLPSGAERPRDSHKGEDSDDGHRDEQLDGDDGVNLEHRQWWGARSPPCTPGLSPGSSRPLRPRSPKDLTTLALAPLSEVGRRLLPHSEGSTYSPSTWEPAPAAAWQRGCHQ